MSARLTDPGRQGLVDKIFDWGTDAFKLIQLLLDGSATDVAVKAITGVTNANPAVFTSNAHGFSQGDLVCIRGVLGNLSVNQLGYVAAASFAANTCSLVTADGQAIQGSGAYTSGGCAINLTVGDNLDDFDACRVGTDSAALSGKTDTKGVLDANDVSFTGVTGTIHGHLCYQDSGSAATSRTLLFMDGKIQVTVAADIASSGTTLWVEPLEGPIASGVSMVFSNGVTLVTSGAAAEGARSISVTAAPGAIAAGHTAEVQSTGSGLPLTITSGDYTVQFSNGQYKITRV